MICPNVNVTIDSLIKMVNSKVETLKKDFGIDFSYFREDLNNFRSLVQEGDEDGIDN